MLRVFKVKTREYIKETIDINNIHFPWVFGGLIKEPKEGQMNGFVDWRKLINEEKMNSITQQYFTKINQFKPLQLESIVEHSLKSQIYRELERINFELQCFDYGVYNIENIFKVGVYLGRQRNKPLDLKYYNQQINGYDFHCIWRKRPYLTDKATLSLIIDIQFKTQGSVKIINQENQIVYENNPEKIENHTIRIESEIMNCSYLSAKNGQPNLRDMKRLDENLHIIDIDGYLNGNNYTNNIIQ